MRTTKLCAAAVLSVLLCCAAPITASAADTGNGWRTENGRRYYYQDGAPLTGEAEIDGMTYLFAPNGVQQKGWQTVGGKRYYYDKDGNAVFGWVSWRGEQYYVTRENGKQTGPFHPAESALSYQFDACGVMEHQWTQDANGTWYYTGASGEIVVDGIPYLLDENGKLLDGWQTASDGKARCYDAATHTLKTGWLEQNGMRVYADPATGTKKTGYVTIDGEHYLLDAQTGEALTGIQTLPNGVTRYFRDPDGAEQYGLITFDIGTCYFDQARGRVIGFWTADEETRFYDLNGIMQYGLVGFEEGLRYFDMETGAMHYGPTEVDGRYYDFGTEGIALLGWGTVDGGKCWYGADGARVTGWQTIDGKRYYFSTTGKLCVSTVMKTADGTYVFDAEGKAATGWQTVDGKTYHCNEQGIADTGWKELDNYGYYFSEDGVMAVSTKIGDYTIDAQGHARSSMAVTVDNLLAQTQGWPMSIYSYCVNHYRYSRIEATRTYSQLSTAGWDKLVTYTLNNRRGVCYYLAATMDYFLHRKGYTCRMVHATHNTGNHYWNQVLIDGVWQNYDPTYSDRGNITWNDQIARGNYIILGYVTTHYDARGTYTGDTYVAA